MGKKLRVITATLVVALGVTGTAFALVNGSPDNGKHPYAGMAVWFHEGGVELCTGSLVSANVFVTAAHCFPEGAHVIVDLNEHAYADLHQPGFGEGWPGIAHPDPNYSTAGKGLANSDRNDISVVQLLGPGLPQPGDRYAQLPAQGSNDALPNNQAIELVGYGVQDPSGAGFGSRLLAGAKIIPGGGASGSEFLKISSSPAHGGATCFGDSGGPNLQAGTDLMLAISSYGPSATCRAVSYSQRMDTPEALRFVGTFLR